MLELELFVTKTFVFFLQYNDV